MELDQLLTTKADEIVDEAVIALSRAHLERYQAAGAEVARQRLRTLYDLIRRCASEKRLGAINDYAESLANERFGAGFDLREVQTAFNVLEEAIWHRVLRDLQPAEFAQAIGVVSTVLGAGKDTLARTYVALASRTKAPVLDVSALFRGTEGR